MPPVSGFVYLSVLFTTEALASLKKINHVVLVIHRCECEHMRQTGSRNSLAGAQQPECNVCFQRAGAAQGPRGPAWTTAPGSPRGPPQRLGFSAQQTSQPNRLSPGHPSELRSCQHLPTPTGLGTGIQRVSLVLPNLCLGVGHTGWCARVRALSTATQSRTRVMCAWTSVWVYPHMGCVYTSMWAHVHCVFMRAPGVGVSMRVHTLRTVMRTRMCVGQYGECTAWGFLDPRPHPSSCSGWA